MVEFLVLFNRSRSPYAQVIGRTSSVQSSCPTPTVRRSSRALATASSTTRTLRRVPSTTDSVSSPAIMEQRMRYWNNPRFLKTPPSQLRRCLLWTPTSFCFVRLWRYQMTRTHFCPAGKTAPCGGLTFAWRRAALRKTAKMYVTALVCLRSTPAIAVAEGATCLCCLSVSFL